MIELFGMLSTAGAQTVELPTTTLGSLRTRGMAGASLAVAEGASSVRENPAALAVRRSFREQTRIELDSSIQLGAHPLLTQGFERVLGEVSGPRVRARWQGALGLRTGPWATGASVAEDSIEDDDSRWVGRWWSLGVGRAGPTWALGVSSSLLQFRGNVGTGIEGSVGGGLTLGGLWAPHASPWRLGARARTPIRTGPLSDGQRLRVPFEAGVGVSRTFGARNRKGPYGPERAPVSWGCDWLLVDVEVLLTGGGADAVALSPLLVDEDLAPVGGPTLRARAGVETSLWFEQLRLRAGIATVPPRGSVAGFEATAGAGIQVFEALGLSYRIAGYVGWGPNGWSFGVGGETW
ncbi:MAG: hypothetical protein AAGA48_21645 [Myxococcota bacterium]